MARPFRSPESYVAERTTRGMLRSFLAERGFTEIEDVRQDFGQTLTGLKFSSHPGC